MNKDDILKHANKDKVATGIIGDVSKKFGIPPMYVRGGVIVAGIFHPYIAVAAYGAGFAYKKFKK